MKTLCGICGLEQEIDEAMLAAECRKGLDLCTEAELRVAQEAQQEAVTRWLPAVSHRECIEKQARQVETNAQRVLRFHRLEKWNKRCPFPNTDYCRIEFRLKAEALNHVASGGSALMQGPTGKGKTRLAWIMGKKPHMDGRSVHTWTHISFSKKAAADAMKGANWVDLLLNQTASCDFLLLDDFGKARMVGADGQSLQNEDLIFEIIDRRLNHRRQTIITTNDSRETLMAKMTSDKAAPLIGRLLDLCKPFSHEEQKL